MILSNMTNKTKVDDDLAEVLDADFDSYVLNPWTWVDPDGGTPHYGFTGGNTYCLNTRRLLERLI
jgi:hypothetical protein